MTEKGHIGVIVLAAGSSSRLGRPKQLVQFKGRSLLQHTLDAVAGSGLKTAVLVTGAHNEFINSDLHMYSFVSVHNHDWEKGMSGSIQKGLEKVLESEPNAAGVLITVSDQPFISEELIRKLYSAFSRPDDLVVSEYKGTIGVPAIIGRDHFEELKSLTGDTGAKKIMMTNSEHLKRVPFEKGDIDIDTSDDIDLLNSIES